MSDLCAICGETTLTHTVPPNSAAALTASSAEVTSRAGTTGIPAPASIRRVASSDHWPRRQAAGGTGTGMPSVKFANPRWFGPSSAMRTAGRPCVTAPRRLTRYVRSPKPNWTRLL